MEEEFLKLVLLGFSWAFLCFWVWKAFDWLWWGPLKLQRQLNEQGLRGPSYRFFYGNVKENVDSLKKARSKPMDRSHKIAPRVLPYLHQTSATYGKLSIFWYGTSPRVNVMEPELVKEILCNKGGQIFKKRLNPLSNLLVAGLLSHNGDKWTKHRRIMNPAFHQEKLKMMLPAFSTSSEELVIRWEKLISERSSCEVDVWPEFQNLTGDVISRTAFGSNYEQGRRIFQLQIEQVEHVTQAVQSVYIPGLRFLPTKRNKRMREIEREIKTILREMIHKREKAIKLGEVQSNDLLGLLLGSNFREIEENGNSKNVGMTINEIMEECKLFYFAGQETTSTLLVWTMVVLSMHPEWQERAREEVFKVFGSRKPDFDELSHLKIVTMVLHEVLRLYPPVPFFTRHTQEKMKLGDITLPPGIQIGLPTLLVHHDRDLWGEDAEEFNPERFSGGVAKATKNQVSFFPFGWGPRICIGQNFAMIEAKLALAMILQRFSFQLSPSYLHAPYSAITLQPQYGAQIILHRL